MSNATETYLQQQAKTFSATGTYLEEQAKTFMDSVVQAYLDGGDFMQDVPTLAARLAHQMGEIAASSKAEGFMHAIALCEEEVEEWRTHGDHDAATGAKCCAKRINRAMNKTYVSEARIEEG